MNKLDKLRTRLLRVHGQHQRKTVQLCLHRLLVVQLGCANRCTCRGCDIPDRTGKPMRIN
jgi:hypothetical protein